MVDFVALGAEGLERAATLLRTAPRIPAESVRPARANTAAKQHHARFGKNYHEHAREFAGSGFDASAKQTIPDAPVIFTKALSAVVGQGDEVRVSATMQPRQAMTRVSWALASALVGTRCPRQTHKGARLRVHIVNDVTIRDLQKRHVQPFIGKSAATYCPIGPVLLSTADEVDDDGLVARADANHGELRQDAPVKDLIFDIPRLISSISAAVRLEAGDVIATGTPAGVGLGFDPPGVRVLGERHGGDDRRHRHLHQPLRVTRNPAVPADLFGLWKTGPKF